MNIVAIRHCFVCSFVSAVRCQRLGGNGFLSVGKPLSGATGQSSFWLIESGVDAYIFPVSVAPFRFDVMLLSAISNFSKACKSHWSVVGCGVARSSMRTRIDGRMRRRCRRFLVMRSP